MKLYINTKRLNFEEENNIEHEIILGISDTEFYGYDCVIELSDEDKFIKDNFFIIYKKDKDGKDTKEIENKVFKIREEETWWSFSKFEVVDGKIIPFKWENYSYFLGTDRRMALAGKINDLFNAPSELKILRKTIRYILQELKLDCPDFLLYNKKVEEIIKKNPKEKK